MNDSVRSKLARTIRSRYFYRHARYPQWTNRPRLGKALRVQSQIDRLERKLAGLIADVPRNLLVRPRYGFTAAEMTKIARNLHARAKEKIARGRGKEFHGLIEDLL